MNTAPLFVAQRGFKHTSLLLVALLSGDYALAQQAAWNFTVLLDGTPIGRHRFDVSTQGDWHSVRSEAHFNVKFLGLTVYGYQHHADEQWQGNCLRALKSSTVEGGKAQNVQLNESGLPSCIMSYAYWNPRLLQQSRLVNPQTGKIDAVTITALGTGSINVRGAAVTAQHWQIAGLPTPIDLWYAPSAAPDQAVGAWLGLDSRPNGRLLSYRLQ